MSRRQSAGGRKVFLAVQCSRTDEEPVPDGFFRARQRPNCRWQFPRCLDTSFHDVHIISAHQMHQVRVWSAVIPKQMKIERFVKETAQRQIRNADYRRGNSDCSWNTISADVAGNRNALYLNGSIGSFYRCFDVAGQQKAIARHDDVKSVSFLWRHSN